MKCYKSYIGFVASICYDVLLLVLIATRPKKVFNRRLTPRIGKSEEFAAKSKASRGASWDSIRGTNSWRSRYRVIGQKLAGSEEQTANAAGIG